MLPTLLSLPYLPSVEWLAVYIQSEAVVIEKHEYFVKGSYMNRSTICGANGLLLLSIPLAGGRDHKMLYADAEISYSSAWQRIHINSIKSAYGSAPFFEYYMSHFEKIISKKHKLVYSLNLELLAEILRLLKCGQKHSFTDAYEKSPSIIHDCRVSVKLPDVEFTRYFQVFEERHGFKTGLSILDLLFHVGPESANYLKMCKIR